MSIKVITKPTVEIVGRTSVDEDGISRFLAEKGIEHWDTDTDVSGQKLIEMAGRLCYMSFAKPRPGGNGAYIEHILSVGHGSVLEHTTWNIAVAGISRSLSHELVRHRIGMSPSQLSQRYVDSTDVAFVVPPAYFMFGNESIVHPPYKHWYKACEDASEAYDRLTELSETIPEIAKIENKTDRRKAARESARSVLPNCTETAIFLTFNGRAMRHFLDLRGSLHADAEIRRLALAIYSLVSQDSPAIFGDFSVATNSEGRTYLKSIHGSV